MYADDRVLVGVVKNLQDLCLAYERGWYRIPIRRWHNDEMEYLAIFINGKLRKKCAEECGRIVQNSEFWNFEEGRGAICCYAEVLGYELAYRHHLLPQQADHPRAHEVYCCLKLGEIRERIPPIVNMNRYRFSFIKTNWERFTYARRIAQLFGNQTATLAQSA